MGRPLQRGDDSVFGPSVMRQKVEIFEECFRFVGVESFAQFVAGAHVIDENITPLCPQSAFYHFWWRLNGSQSTELATIGLENECKIIVFLTLHWKVHSADILTCWKSTTIDTQSQLTRNHNWHAITIDMQSQLTCNHNCTAMVPGRNWESRPIFQ